MTIEILTTECNTSRTADENKICHQLTIKYNNNSGIFSSA